MGERHSYIRIMSDIIDSGIWAKLSHAAKTLYPVLLKFSDYNFKPVWPNTETLLGLTGFQTKKSLTEAKRDLERHGLLHIIPGTGRTSTRYYFLFDYPGSRITPLGDTGIHPRESDQYPSGGSIRSEEGGITGLPNHINITINNNQTNKSKELKNSRERKTGHSQSLDTENENLAGEPSYDGVIKFNRKNGASMRPSLSWSDFLDWVDQKLSRSSALEFHGLDVSLDGKILFVESPVTHLQKNIIESFFEKDPQGDVSLVFASPKVENRIF